MHSIRTDIQSLVRYRLIGSEYEPDGLRFGDASEVLMEASGQIGLGLPSFCSTAIQSSFSLLCANNLDILPQDSANDLKQSFGRVSLSSWQELILAHNRSSWAEATRLLRECRVASATLFVPCTRNRRLRAITVYSPGAALAGSIHGNSLSSAAYSSVLAEAGN
jgi:hypothetical protein